jgi:hypothetical protein
VKKYGCIVVVGILFCVVAGWVLSCKDKPMVYPNFPANTPAQYITMLNRAEKLSGMTKQKEVIYNPVRRDDNFNTVNSLNEEQQKLYDSLLTLLRDNRGRSLYYRKDRDVYFRLTLEDSWGCSGFWAYEYSSTGDRFAVPSIKESIEKNQGDPIHYCEPIEPENWFLCYDDYTSD